jgi:3-hydroxyisobutyrate dehydrogenase-like beta-hydroxyacid dehydrogenase
MKLGFIGLGNLGTPIAENLLQKGHELLLYNRTTSKALALKEKGGVIANSIKELAGVCDIIFSIVSDDKALDEITLGNEGIAMNLKQDGIHVSMSTILPATAKHLHEVHSQHSNHYVAAPVMGRPEAARMYKINFLVSGEADVIKTITPYLHDGGATGVWEFGGEVSAANVAKLCSNFLIISAIEAMAEGINLANKGGIDTGKWMAMLTQTIFSSPVYTNYSDILLREAWQPGGFALRLGLKDVNLVLQQAQTVQAKTPTAELAKKQFDACIEKGLAEHDWTAIALALK